MPVQTGNIKARAGGIASGVMGAAVGRCGAGRCRSLVTPKET